MKELSIEQKAKAYDAALEYAHCLIEQCKEGTCGSFHRADLDKMFPELAESEDERIRKALKEYFINSFQNNGVAAICGVHIKDILAFLEKQGEQKPAEDRYMEGYLNGINDASKTLKPAAWSEEDRETIDYLIDYLESELDSSYTDLDKETFTKEINWLKSLRPRNTWKPSEEMLEALYRVIPENVMEISEDEMLLDKLYQGLKYGRVLSKN